MHGNDEAPEAIPQVTARQLGYAMRHWSLEDGLPLDRLHSLAQTKDGYLWIGADTGKLCRFDGTRFTRLNTESHPLGRAGRYTHLLSDPTGGLWLRGWFLPLGRYSNGQFVEIPGIDPLVPSYDSGPTALGLDGSLWMADMNPLRFFHWVEGEMKVIPCDASVSSRQVVRMEVDRNGTVWGLGYDRKLFRLTEDGAEDYVWDNDGEGAEAWVGGLMKLISGDLAVCSSTGLYQLRGNRWVRTKRWASPIKPVNFAVQCNDGTVWMTTWHASQLYCLRGEHLRRVDLTDAKPPVSFNSLLADNVGNVWIATHQGLFQMRPTLFRTWSVAEGLPGPRVYSVTSGVDSRIWLKTSAYDVYCRFSSSSGEDVLEKVPVASRARFVVPFDENSRWLAAREPDAVWIWENDQIRLVSEGLNGTRDPTYIASVLRTQRGELWIATGLGVYRCAKTGCSPVPFADRSLMKKASHGLAEDSSGRIYVSTLENGIYAFEDGVLVELAGLDDGMEAGAIDAAPDHSLWAVVSRNQLARWRNGEWRLLDPKVTRGIARIESLRYDDHGGLWLGTETEGVVWMNQSDLDAVANGRKREVDSLRFGRHDGLGSLACSGQSSGMVKGPDGRVWIATADGISVVDPQELRSRKNNSNPPTVVIEEALIDDQLVELNAHGAVGTRLDALSIPPGSSRLEVRFAAIDLASEDQVRFQYKLGNYAEAWESAASDRSAVFHRLPPGQYDFAVRAANAYGLWSEETASLAIAVLPFWWQRSLVQAVFVFLALTAIWCAYLAQVRSWKRRQAMQESFSRELINSQERERKRIASELHDGLGQELLLIKNGNLMMAHRLPEVPDLRERARKIGDLSAKALQSIRAITLDLRPPEIDRLGLAEAVEGLVETAAEHSSLIVTCHVEVLENAIGKNDEIHLFRIVQEALNNALKYAQATHIKVEAWRDRDDLVVRIQDDGRGFDPTQAGFSRERGGLGLPGLRERARNLGGLLTIESTLGVGTTVTLRIPECPHE